MKAIWQKMYMIINEDGKTLKKPDPPFYNLLFNWPSAAIISLTNI
ncbi:MAG TPA: hypothetical protein VK498_10250 [Ferruginibacter sp.]|nr:hypothetical protein [Ferruginibacter sp.]